MDQSLRMASSKNRVNDRNLAIVKVAEAVAKELERSAAQVAIRWSLQKPGVTSVILGARTPAQLEDNLNAATLVLNDEQMARLDEASKIEIGYPHTYLKSASVTRFLYGGAIIEE
jgi:aryl-alcohol dehydrogenase-like predicted oxidoreductase